MWWFSQFFGFAIYPFVGDTGKRNKSKINKIQNDILSIITSVRLILTSLERYDITGLPDTVSKRVVLQSLLWYGCVAFFEKDNSVLALPATPAGDGFNIYGDPGSAFVYSRNGRLNEEIKLFIPGSDEESFLKMGTVKNQTGKPKGVMVWENKARFPFINTVLFFSDVIADTYRTLDVCRFWMKRPVIFTAEESEIQTINRFISQMENNNEYAINSGILGKETKLIETHTDSGALDSCTSLLEWYESKFRELCGIDSNSQQDKKGENLITAELSINDEMQSANVDQCIEEIQKGLDIANRIFGTSMKCEKKRRETKDDLSDIQNGKGDTYSRGTLPDGDTGRASDDNR